MVRIISHSKGYRMLRIEEPDVQDGPVFVSLHRLVAFAERDLDGLRFEQDPREVHHRDGIPERNGAHNLDALPLEDHAQITRSGEYRRTA